MLQNAISLILILTHLCFLYTQYTCCPTLECYIKVKMVGGHKLMLTGRKKVLLISRTVKVDCNKSRSVELINPHLRIGLV